MREGRLRTGISAEEDDDEVEEEEEWRDFLWRDVFDSSASSALLASMRFFSTVEERHAMVGLRKREKIMSGGRGNERQTLVVTSVVVFCYKTVGSAATKD